jgi:hypothetical protein
VKQKVQAGATLEMATPEEVREAIASGLRSWQAEAIRGMRYTRFSASAVVTAGAFVIDGNAERLGPEAGFVWDVRRLRIVGMGGADVATLYVNDPAPSQMIASTDDNATTTGTGALFLWDKQLILQPGDNLVVTGTSLVSTSGTVTVNGQVLEVPVSQAWRLH